MSKLIELFQQALLYAAYYLLSPFVPADDGLWVVGVDEVANNTFNISRAFSKSFTVNLHRSKYYDNIYDFSLRERSLPGRWVVRGIVGPILLGYLANRASNFFYIGATGFLHHSQGGREIELAFLKRRGKKIVAFFCGSDIRSLKLSLEHARQHGLDVMATYMPPSNPGQVDNTHEDRLKRLSESADRYADYIFNAPVDQISYIQRAVHPFMYFYPDAWFFKAGDKFRDMRTIKIVHAPTSPFIKGTPLVRAAIKKLKLLGYNIDYVELINVKNEVVREHLLTTHLVVNELYSFLPGLLGVEAMANNCALLTSADRNIEPTLPEGANDAWLVTRYWDVFDNLKYLLENPDLIEGLANRGYDWAFNNCRTSVSRNQLLMILESR